MRLLHSLLVVMLTTTLAGCSMFSKEDEVPPDQGERALYDTARKNLDNSNFDLAIKNLQLLEARYPFGPYAEQWLGSNVRYLFAGLIVAGILLIIRNNINHSNEKA